MHVSNHKWAELRKFQQIKLFNVEHNRETNTVQLTDNEIIDKSEHQDSNNNEN
jgi:hypothetical protein